MKRRRVFGSGELLLLRQQGFQLGAVAAVGAVHDGYELAGGELQVYFLER